MNVGYLTFLKQTDTFLKTLGCVILLIAFAKEKEKIDSLSHNYEIVSRDYETLPRN